MTPSAAYRAPVSSRRGLDDPLQERVERQLGAQRDARVDEDPQALESGGLRHRGEAGEATRP